MDTQPATQPLRRSIYRAYYVARVKTDLIWCTALHVAIKIANFANTHNIASTRQELGAMNIASQSSSVRVCYLSNIGDADIPVHAAYVTRHVIATP